ncbi:hypothetical protein V5O48_015231 [Marasmius crinis-equi]|uniref:F-box domain-containing protein n=1 Tax=Marasmius crinis-equi TaxID=585013 RepID=A0ABR3EV49_9AGAR
MPQNVSKETGGQQLFTAIEHRIPVEIWQSIFAFVCSSKECGYALLLDSSDPLKPPFKFPPFIISQVCSRWREAAINSPPLWSSISIKLSSLPYFASDILQLYLENSKQSRLDIRIHGDHLFAYIHKEIKMTWNTLVPHFRRCKSLSCSKLAGEFRIPKESFPNLVTLEDTFIAVDAQWQSYFQVAPELTTIKTFCLYPYRTFPYSQLTSMDCRYLQQHQVETLIRHILPSSKRLQCLTVGVDVSRGGRESEGSIALDQAENLPALRKLVLSDGGSGAFMDSISLRDIFESFKAPGLTSLRVECAENRRSGWSPSFVAFLSQASASLQHFTLSIRHCTVPEPQTLSSLVEMVPNLTEFGLEMENGSWAIPGARRLDIQVYQAFARSYVGNLFFDLQVADHVPAVLAPRLTSVSVSLPDLQLDSDALARVLSAAESRTPTRLSVSTRGAGMQPLTNLRIAYRSGLDTGGEATGQASKGVERLLQNGVQVAIEDFY